MTGVYEISEWDKTRGELQAEDLLAALPQRAPFSIRSVFGVRPLDAKYRIEGAHFHRDRWTPVSM